jgi:hypothetical protein
LDFPDNLALRAAKAEANAVSLPLVMAGCLTILMGLVHSIVGEIKVLRRVEGKRDLAGAPIATEWTMRLLRGTWHTLSLFGFGLGFTLFTLGNPTLGGKLGASGAIAISCAVVGIYWGIATRFWHPAWIVFLLVAALCWWA